MRLNRPLTVANTAAIVALAVGVGAGSAYAVPAIAAKLANNSVTTNTIANGAVTNAKLHTDAVTSGRVKDRSLLARDFAVGQLPAGAAGPKGDPGTKGDTGDPGTKGDTGDPGAKGDTGDPGAKGDTGARGPSDGYTASYAGVQVIDYASPTVLVGMTLPAGTYLLSATSSIENTSQTADTPVIVTCKLFSGGSEVTNSETPTSVVSRSGGYGFASVALSGSVTLAADTFVKLQCQQTSNVGASALNPHIAAIAVGALH